MTTEFNEMIADAEFRTGEPSFAVVSKFTGDIFEARRDIADAHDEIDFFYPISNGGAHWFLWAGEPRVGYLVGNDDFYSLFAFLGEL